MGERGGEEGKEREPVKKDNAIEQAGVKGRWGLHTPRRHPTPQGGQPGDVPPPVRHPLRAASRT